MKARINVALIAVLVGFSAPPAHADDRCRLNQGWKIQIASGELKKTLSLIIGSDDKYWGFNRYDSTNEPVPVTTIHYIQKDGSDGSVRIERNQSIVIAAKIIEITAEITDPNAASESNGLYGPCSPP